MPLVKHEPPDQRRHIRSSAPISALIRGVPYTVPNWSLGGFRVDDFTQNLSIGERLFVQFTLTYQGLEVSFTTEILIVRMSEDRRTIAGAFLHLREREKELLRYTMLGTSHNGERASLIESMARIDIPVTPISPVPTPREAPPLGRARQLFRRIACSLLYGAVGVALGLTVCLTLYWYFFRLDLDYAVVSLPLHPVICQDVALCREVFLEEGSTVTAGQPILRLEDDLLLRDLETSQLQFSAAKVEVQTAKARVHREKEKLAFYKSITEDKLVSARELVQAFTEQLRVAEQELKRARSLSYDKAVSRESVEKAEAKYAQQNGQLTQAKAELRIEQMAQKSVELGDFYDHFRLVGDLPQLLVNLEDARQRLRLAEDHLRYSQQRVQRLTYLAPFAGRLVKILKPAGTIANRGEALAIIEEAGREPVIDAFLTQDDAGYLMLGSSASVWIPSLDRTYRATLVQIDRTTGFLSEMQAHLKESQLRYNWRGQYDRSAYAQLTIMDPLSPAEKAALTGGMPVTVSVPKRPGLWNKTRLLFHH